MNAIDICGVGKKYHLGNKYTTLFSLFSNWKNRTYNKDNNNQFWALKNISFEISHGEVVGIVGRNGAGKSTLLKILSRITPPTTGKITINGRLASLLEVGTGFHPELSGRENIYMNGAILGLKKHEIKKKLDEIIDFSGISKFIDTPVKYYSSGMYVRLAFAVAAHLEPEILVVDEVLAVGDAGFQKKCLGKMQDITSSGRTIIFVSHNLPAIETLCKKCVYLVKGELKAFGKTSAVLPQYLTIDTEHKGEVSWSESNAPGDEFVKLISVRILNADHQPSVLIEFEKPCTIEMTYQVLKPGAEPIPNLHFITGTGTVAFCSVMPLLNDTLGAVGKHTAIVEIPAYFFNSGLYFLTVGCSTTLPIIVHFYLQELLSFEVSEDLNLRETHYKGDYPGVVRTRFKWDYIFNN
jgi:lipopolysaccharide transport system ATP-binding protein